LLLHAPARWADRDVERVDDETRVRPNGGDGESWDAYVSVTDAQAPFAEFEAKGARVVHLPVDRDFYGHREFAVRDIGAYVIARPRHRSP